MKKRVLVLGCTGEIGSNLTRNLLSQGFITFGISGGKPCEIIHPNHQCAKIDLLSQKNLFEAIDFKPHILIHTAWITKFDSYKNSVINYDWLRASKKIISDFINQNGEYFAVTSTCFEYLWGTNEPISENSKLAPHTIYGQAKLELLEWILATTQIPFLWTRTFFQFGLTEPSGRLVPSMIDSLLSTKKFLIKSPFETRDYVFVLDVVSVLSKLISNQSSGIFNIGTGIGISLIDLATLIGNILNLKELIIFDKTNLSSQSIVSNSNKLYSKIGNINWTPIEISILKTIEARKK